MVQIVATGHLVMKAGIRSQILEIRNTPFFNSKCPTVLTVTDRNIAYGENLLKTLVDADIRARGDFRNEKLGFKVREAQLQKIPYMLIVGDRECEKEGLTPRLRSGQNLSFMTAKEFIDRIGEECKARR